MKQAGYSCVAMALVVVGCSSSAQQEFGRTDAQDIRTTIQAFGSAYNQKDAGATAGFFSGSGVLMPPNSSPVRGMDSIKGFYDIRFKDGPGDLTVEVSDVGGHGPLAYASGTYSLRVHPAAGPESKDRGKFIWIVRNYAGRWRFDYQMWNSDLPVPTGTAAAAP